MINYGLSSLLLLLLIGVVLSTFAGVACLSSKFRKKDDYVNAFIAGGSAFSIFGILGN